MASFDKSGDGSEQGAARTGSGEWRDLARELRAADGAVHDEALEMVRGIVSALRRRNARRATTPAAIFGGTIRKGSA